MYFNILIYLLIHFVFHKKYLIEDELKYRAYLLYMSHSFDIFLYFFYENIFLYFNI